jgi:hypothetical protein
MSNLLLIEFLVRFILITVIVCALLVMFMAAPGAEDWSNCKQAYEFCTRRPFHRDCSIWTIYGRGLVITRFEKEPRNPAADTQFCRDNPWHMSCGRGGTEKVYGEQCLLP